MGVEVDVISSFIGVTVTIISCDSELHAINNEIIEISSNEQIFIFIL